METTAARALNELWRDHLFQLGITFHAGRECITYEWGAKNHVKESGKSDKSPDNLSQQQLSRVMSRFGGKFEDSAQYYPDGTMNDVVYAVDGGMEDWGYAASWENEYTTPKPIKECNRQVSGDTQPRRPDTTMLRTGLFSADVDFATTGTYYVQAIATVDQDWATQGTGEDIPVPKVKPQTHIVNARTNDDWLYSNNGRVVRGQTVWTSQTVKIVVT
ncbi:Tetratricopeptide repeat protein 38 [Phytophthora nicotianae]|uniref:Tetratricopeptide repeat protein 38 n=1 Tax=Phytophthora nicotianae TaxID=4792 RepID=A0A0W8DUD0_PHYNI|nr:Tetratricopeptide repeat protein 38 [Phytophthora nicotianae]